MVTTKRKSLDHYINRIEKHLLRKYPHLEFEVVKSDHREATIYYKPYCEEDDFAIIHRVGGIATDALVEDDYSIHIQPA